MPNLFQPRILVPPFSVLCLYCVIIMCSMSLLHVLCSHCAGVPVQCLMCAVPVCMLCGCCICNLVTAPALWVLHLLPCHCTCYLVTAPALLALHLLPIRNICFLVCICYIVTAHELLVLNLLPSHCTCLVGAAYAT